MPTPTFLTWMITGEKPLFQSTPASLWAEPDDDETVKPARKPPMYPGATAAFEIAKSQLYINAEGRNYHPGMSFYKCLQKACAGRVLGRTPALKPIVQAVSPVEEEFLLLDPATLDAKKPKAIDPKSWLVDKRLARNHNKNRETGGVAVVVIRPKWPIWGGLLTFEVDADLFKNYEGLTELLNMAGHIFGIGVGRRRLFGIRNRQEIWSDMGMGRFSAVLVG